VKRKRAWIQRLDFSKEHKWKTTKDYLMHVQDLHGVGFTGELSLASFIALCSAALNKPVQKVRWLF
jgi:predicted ATP-dependent Lon-type protease